MKIKDTTQNLNIYNFYFKEKLLVKAIFLYQLVNRNKTSHSLKDVTK